MLFHQILLTMGKSKKSTSKYDSRLETKSVFSLYGQKDMISFDAVYQRESVWKYKQRALFIDSIMKGIVPNNIIVNSRDEGDSVDICIDGKQRLNTLFDFMDNKFPIKIGKKVVFFSKVNKKLDMEEFDKAMVDLRQKTLNERDRGQFKKQPIPFVTYTGLTYPEEVEIFKRIQNGESLRPGEKVVCNIKSEEIAIMFRDFCDEMKTVVEKLYKESDLVRDKHMTFIAGMMSMIDSNSQYPPSSTVRGAFMSDQTSKKEFKKIIKKTEKFFRFFFTLFDNESVESKWNLRYLQTIMFTMFSKIEDYEEFLSEKKECNAVLHVLKYYHEEITDGDFKKANKKKFEEVFDGLWDKYGEYLSEKKLENLLDKKFGKSVDSDEDEDEDEDEDDSDSDGEITEQSDSDEDEDEDENESEDDEPKVVKKNRKKKKTKSKSRSR